MAEPSKQRESRSVTPGQYYPLGATIQETGVNFALYSQNASEVFLLLFDKEDGAPVETIKIESKTKSVWHVHVAGLKAGQLYGYKVNGPFNPALGLRFNQHKLLIDPYAKAITRKPSNVDNLLLSYDAQSFESDKSLDTRENMHVVPKCIVVDDDFDWQGDASPNIALENSISTKST